MKKELSRRSGVRIAAELMKLLGGRLSAVMLLAVLNGSLGFLCAMGVPFFGAVGIAKALGESIPLTYGAIAGLCVGCGVLRGGLRYLEQYDNHYIAFRLLGRRAGPYLFLCALTGADLLLAADLLARSLSPGAELPLSIFTVLFAVPVLIALLCGRREGGDEDA